MANSKITINTQDIKFVNACPFDIDQIYQLEGSEPLDKFDILFKNLNVEEQGHIKKLITKYKNLFYQDGEQLTCTSSIEHEIVTTTDAPIYSKIYRYPQIHEEEISRQIEEMLKQGIIKESNSPYNSPLWIVPKKADNSGKKKWRLVVDYRKLNEVTVDDKFPLPNIDNLLDKLGKAMYFTTLDLANGFHQILVKECDQKKTAFSTPQGHFEYIRMPFGLKNAPATFQRIMNNVLKKHINKICVVYMDDILVFSTSLQEHIDSLQQIFETLGEHNLKVQFDKCNFLSKETEFLGHILTSEGVKPNPKKIQVIQDLSLPKTPKQIKSFLGIAGYYRKFIKDFAKISQPMIQYLRKGVKLNINDPNYILSFEKLKSIMTQTPVLKYPDFTKTFKIATDASDFAIGAVLQQDKHPICYASRTLNDHERNYSTTDKELLAIVWATNYFRPYLYGRRFDLLTDHQPLKWLYAKTDGKDINPRLQRWLLKLGEYDINIDYIKGQENKVADFLSRITSDEIHHINTDEEIEDSRSLINNVDNESVAHIDEIETIATIHSQPEFSNDHIPILETAVNRFKTQNITRQH